jgi:hypothetical protein
MRTTTDDASTADLVRQASEQISTLVRDELNLARLELAEKAKHAGTGAGLFGAAGAVALYGVGALIVTGGLLLALVLPEWLAALIVTVVLFAIAGILALVGRGQVREVGSPVPQEAVDGVKADVHTVTAAAKEGQHR